MSTRLASRSMSSTNGSVIFMTVSRQTKIMLSKDSCVRLPLDLRLDKLANVDLRGDS